MAAKQKKFSPKRNEIEFNLLAPDAQSVYLSGDFNHWDPSSHPLERTSEGFWKIYLNLDPGPYQYRFLVDGQWHNDPGCQSCIPNAFGTLNCLKVIE